jgi:hypothetical protein
MQHLGSLLLYPSGCITQMNYLCRGLVLLGVANFGERRLGEVRLPRS